MFNIHHIKTQVRPRSFAYGSFFSCLAVAGVIASAALADAAGPPTLAVANFDFRDTSGEVRNQTREHEARLKAFGVRLRDDLSEDQKIKLITLTCQVEPCTVRTSGLDVLSTQARTAGVRYLLFGEVQKTSTLVGWVKFAVLDLKDNKPLCDRFLTYRGDTDDAWQHAAKFTARAVEKNCLP